uniref:Pre-rRNA-processing protein TSR1 homolog n=1 Tax=Lygus hesperus TaxID=30085 RepID=A0A146LG16_LYGHE
MGADTIHQHRPGGLKQQNKAHKHGKRSKGSIERLSKGRAMVDKKPSKKQHAIGREERRNQAKQVRAKKRFEYLEKRRDICEAPFLVGLVPLSDEIDVDEVIEFLKKSDPESEILTTALGYVHMWCPRLKQRYTLATVKGDNLFDKMDLMKVCSTICLLSSITGVDDNGKITLTALVSQGLPAVTVVVTDMSTLPPKKWQDGKNQIENELSRWLPEIDKIMTMDKTGDGLNILRKIALQKQKSLIMRDRRPHLLGESLHFIETDVGVGTLQVTGYLRGVPLNVNSLVHIPGWGDFQMSKIERAPLPGDLTSKPILLEEADSSKQESLESEAIVDPMDAEQTWPTAEELAEATKQKEPRKVKKVPHGMSEYQAAWIPDVDAVELSEDEEDEEAMTVDGEEDDDEKSEDQMEEDDDALTETSEAPVAPDKYDRDLDMAEESAALKKFKQDREHRAKEDALFPDEVDTPRDIPAKTRFIKYRGLKSFRTTPWDPKENLPADYARIFQFQNFKRMKAAVLSEERTGAETGWYITVHIKNVPTVLNALRGTQPVVVYGLLPHEQKMSVLNLFLKSTPELVAPIESKKEELLFQVGYRRFKACPIYSTPSTKGNKHKYERFFRPNSEVVATMYAPVIFPPAPVLAFKEDEDGTLSLVASGNVQSVDPDRIVVKRAVLSGHPFKIFKRSAIIRFMFYNREDIEWFKPVELRTKYGRRGHIKEPLGTHGHMKCVFNSQLKSQDTVLLNLYKRIFPKWTYEPNAFFVPAKDVAT